MASLETGDLKLRVRVLEAERAARRAGVMQVSNASSGAGKIIDLKSIPVFPLINLLCCLNKPYMPLQCLCEVVQMTVVKGEAG